MAQGALAPPSRQLRVLLVDDDPVNCEAGAAILQRLGHHTTIARNGASAVELARDQAFDVILMDLHMPDMDGVEAASRIGELGLAKMPRLIAVTADVSGRARDRLAGAGIAKVVSKPILINALREAVEDDLVAEPAAAQRPATELIDRPFLDDQRELLGAAQIDKLHHLLQQTGERLIHDIADAAAAGDHKHLALRASTWQRGKCARPRPPVRAQPRRRAGGTRDVTCRTRQCHTRTRRDSTGVDASAE
ncbi:CheY-like chemotaxis protein [Bradyrhizobium yuanmingense]|uniref:response regulator n=1 Tax=Bradyrhizobium yuanmingense TaxID=108015 RepID=UPI003517B530